MNPKDLGEHEGRSRYEYVRIILDLAGKYLHEEDGYKKFSCTLEEQLYCQERVVEAYYHMTMTNENLSLLKEALEREESVTEAVGDRSVQG